MHQKALSFNVPDNIFASIQMCHSSESVDSYICKMHTYLQKPYLLSYSNQDSSINSFFLALTFSLNILPQWGLALSLIPPFTKQLRSNKIVFTFTAVFPAS